MKPVGQMDQFKVVKLMIVENYCFSHTHVRIRIELDAQEWSLQKSGCHIMFKVRIKKKI